MLSLDQLSSESVDGVGAHIMQPPVGSPASLDWKQQWRYFFSFLQKCTISKFPHNADFFYVIKTWVRHVSGSFLILFRLVTVCEL